ncbi:MAG: flavodoxin family protein [Proteobacteria bacterium]|nr:flavodoxin family protein [Pseudomonadota bacterium]MBU4298174.1 flavodoxin family protein [Pseudomonadota bacterium]MCG2749677.1 flavodoxin family protein [Desulfobulbaceae bacterium]
MKVMAFNGSPRKKWNTATLLGKALEGAAAQGAETRLVHLYDLDYKGCISCFACKTRGGESYGTCAVQDDLTSLFAEIKEADAIILGSPIYFGDVSGELRSFVERLLFPYLVYDNPPRSLYPRKIRTAWIYTMNVSEDIAPILGYDRLFNSNALIMERIFGHSESLMSYDTYQFKDYTKVVADRFDVDKKEKRRREVFPQDCKKAFNLGAALAEEPA